MAQKYTREFKLEALRLCEADGVRVKDVAKDLGVPLDLLYHWRGEQKRLGAVAFPGKGNPTGAEAELIAVKRELARVQMERDILKNLRWQTQLVELCL